MNQHQQRMNEQLREWVEIQKARLLVRMEIQRMREEYVRCGFQPVTSGELCKEFHIDVQFTEAKVDKDFYERN